MWKKIDYKTLPFILDNFTSLIIFIILCIYMVIIKFQFIFVDIVFIVSSIYFIGNILEMFRIIFEVVNDNLISEEVCVIYICPNKFDGLFNKSYMVMDCRKTKNNRFTNETLALKSSLFINIKEKSFVNVTYYKKSKILIKIDNKAKEKVVKK